jgi:hypothetical protein
MRAHFQKLYDNCSMAAMDAIIEEQCLPFAHVDTPEHDLLIDILVCNDLDGRHLICANYLGYIEDAQQLQDWIEVKKRRKDRR